MTIRIGDRTRCSPPVWRRLEALPAVLSVLTLLVAGCYPGLPPQAVNLAATVAGAQASVEAVVVLDNITDQAAVWHLVWQGNDDSPPSRRDVPVAAGSLQAVVLPGPVNTLSLGSLTPPADGVTLATEPPHAVSFPGPAIDVGGSVADGEVVHFALIAGPDGPSLTVDVIPAG